MSNFNETPKSLPITCDDGLVRPPWAATDPLLREYYDTEWGMPVRDEAGLYERLVLEGFQSGLSWVTICLLYTSPSPRDRQKSRMPSSA